VTKGGGENGTILFMHSSYKKPMDLAASCWTAFLHIGTFAFFAPFARDRSVSCSLPCTLTPLVVLIMESLSPTVHLVVLSCILFATLAVFSPLVWASCNSLSIHWLRRQTCIFGLKFVFDLVRVILLALGISEVILLHNGNSRLV